MVSLYKEAPVTAQASQQHHLHQLLSNSSPHSEAGKCRQGTGTGQPSIRTARESKVENFDISRGIALNSPSSCPSWKGPGGAREGAPGAVTRGMGSLSRGETTNLLALEREGEGWLPSVLPPPAPQHPAVQRPV